MKTVLQFLLLTFSFTYLSVQADPIGIALDDPVVEISFPDGWEILTSDEVIAKMKTVKLADEAFKKKKIEKGNTALIVAQSKYAALTVKRVPYASLEGKSNQEIVNMLFERMNTVYESTQVVTYPYDVTLGGLKGAYGVLDHTENYMNGKATMGRYESWILRSGKNLYSISLKYRSANAAKVKEKIRPILDSIRFTKSDS